MMRLKGIRNIFMAGLFLTGSLFFTSCKEESWDEFWSGLDDVLGEDGDVNDLFGWAETDEDYEHIENDISFTHLSNESKPTSVDLTSQFPPIGNQGSYGTCVAWAVGYNLKTYLEAKEKGYSSSQLSSTAYQFSPKDLYLSIDANYRGADCNGTNFEPALDVLLNRGIASLSTVPYTGLGDCSQPPSSSASSEASSHKITNYRMIYDAASKKKSNSDEIEKFKGYLADGRPVVIGARLGDDFMQWNSSSVIFSDTYLNPGMQHAYHAMIVAGYDDNKGATGAFRVVNSWADNWGDNGYIWVDYDFFISEFCFAGFVATNSLSNPDSDGDNIVDNVDSGADLAPWYLVDTDFDDPDYPTYVRDRWIEYDVFNTGNRTITASEDWNIMYVYYNAYDADEYGILIYDYYTDDYGLTGPTDHPNYAIIIDENDVNYLGQTNWWNNIDVPSGKSVANVLIDADNYEFEYSTPSSLTGYYYFVLIADGFDAIAESNEENNYYFFTEDNGDPLWVSSGVIDDSNVSYGKKSGKLKSTAVDNSHKNAYTPQEITNMLKYHKQSGDLNTKVQEFLKTKNKSGKLPSKTLK